MIDTSFIAEVIEHTLGTAACAAVPLAYSYLQFYALQYWRGLFRLASLVPAAAIAVWFYQMRADVAWSDVSSLMLLAEIWFLALPAGFALLCIGTLQAMAARASVVVSRPKTLRRDGGADVPASGHATASVTR